MKKHTQRTENPYPNSDTNKRYYTYEYYLRRRFGGRCAKIPIDGGFTCPNIDGRCGRGGCSYCSGDFAPRSRESIAEQFAAGCSAVSSKWKTDKYIAYFQAHTNTYAPVLILREKFEAALALPGVVGLNIATRADCLEDDVVDYLSALSVRTCLTVELGLQTANDETARRINRGHSYAQFVEGFEKLRAVGDINICVHLIFGLPGESRADMLDSVKKVASLAPEQVKLHLLYVMEGTPLGNAFLRGEYIPLTEEEYIGVVAEALQLLPPDTVIARLTGDGAPDGMLAPDWSRRKTAVINNIDKLMYASGAWQGKEFRK